MALTRTPLLCTLYLKERRSRRDDWVSPKSISVLCNFYAKIRQEIHVTLYSNDNRKLGKKLTDQIDLVGLTSLWDKRGCVVCSFRQKRGGAKGNMKRKKGVSRKRIGDAIIKVSCKNQLTLIVRELNFSFSDPFSPSKP
ncbi:hypothetical protein K2173_027959 [Erythroxylum novogranatense]|uniref:Uncharacterized protein n=1 Tax=Erythroxylum novogranatense TaxID=1862640 RepID=A0AAV8U0H7_9ROSI|nr:hypothetical protein K2173_027959 [Erythroxylum novogranatense]